MRCRLVTLAWVFMDLLKQTWTEMKHIVRAMQHAVALKLQFLSNKADTTDNNLERAPCEFNGWVVHPNVLERGRLIAHWNEVRNTPKWKKRMSHEHSGNLYLWLLYLSHLLLSTVHLLFVSLQVTFRPRTVVGNLIAEVRTHAQYWHMTKQPPACRYLRGTSCSSQGTRNQVNRGG